jgi:hypothetical protein
VIETGGGDRIKVALGNPCIPMVLKYGQGKCIVLHLPKCVFINDVLVVCVVEYARSYPGLYKKRGYICINMSTIVMGTYLEDEPSSSTEKKKIIRL